MLKLVFQSTLLQEERPQLLLSFGLGHFIFQSTLLQEERRIDLSDCDYLLQLSIHAPTRGATCEILKLTPDYYAFNPRSYKRSDDGELHITVAGVPFQSTLLQEERRVNTVNAIIDNAFNPRSYKRSDKWQPKKLNIIMTFQSTLLQEERHFYHFHYLAERIFQSTLLQEERQAIARPSVVKMESFNPRSYKRSDKEKRTW